MSRFLDKITQGDALELIPMLEDHSIDCFLSDIPYGISLDEWDVLHSNTNSALLGQSPAQEGKSAFKRRGKPIRGWSSADRNIPKEYQDWCYKWGQSLYPKMKNGSSLFIFGARRTIHRAILALEDCGFLVKDMLAWEKPSAHHRAQRLSGILEKRGMYEEAKKWEGWRLGNLAPTWEPIAWLFKPYEYTITDNVLEHELGAINVGSSLIDGKSPTNLLRFDLGEERIHEAQKPVKLLEFLVNLTTREEHVVLDPFIGSGSTAVACKRTKRHFIGFEIQQAYVDLANRRLYGANGYSNGVLSTPRNETLPLFDTED
jgi:site-specific DNA-methyltransferase (adenine-specific)